MLLTLSRSIIHYGCHFLVPGFIAKKWYSKDWKRIYLIFMATMLIDLDHLLSTPIFDPNRLSVGHHFLHSFPAICLYIFLISLRKFRPIGIGLLFHIFTDLLDYSLTLNFF